MNEQPLKRDWFYWFMAIVAATQVPVAVLALLDFVLHPLAPDFENQSMLFRLFSALVIVPVAVFIALLVIRRAPRNVTGWCLLLWATLIISLTNREEAGIVQSFAFGWVGIWFLPLFFPDGRAFPRRFERHVRLLCVGVVLSVAAWTFTAPQSSIAQTLHPVNPLFIPALEGLFPVVSAAEGVFLMAILVIILPSLIARYRGSDQRVRQQLKWLAWVFFGILLTAIPLALAGLTTTRDPLTFNPVETAFYLSWSVFISLAPFLAVAVAILRHRLYDIDIIIRRTLIYSILSGILAVIYFGGVVVAQQVFRAATGETPDIAIVISTLLIWALFGPLRRRIQGAIDRRFYRRKYDVEQTLARFNQTLRDEVDIETLRAQLVGVVQETMQPSKVALWVKD